jgi:hypothetical protein
MPSTHKVPFKDASQKYSLLHGVLGSASIIQVMASRLMTQALAGKVGASIGGAVGFAIGPEDGVDDGAVRLGAVEGNDLHLEEPFEWLEQW